MRFAPVTGLGLAALVLPGRAQAHAFSAGKDAYGAFLEGAGVILSTPSLILPLVALAVMVVLWKTEGLLATWPLFLVGQAAGLALAPLFSPGVALAPLGVGLVVGSLCALVPIARIAAAVPIFGALTGGTVMLAALEGHGWGEVRFPVYLGLVFAANLAVAASAGLARVIVERWPGEITVIALRIAASWVAAILVLFLAFALTGTVT